MHEAYGEPTYQRLVALKDRFDSEDLFHLNANIPPSTSARASHNAVRFAALG
jgi:hypothetical protein